MSLKWSRTVVGRKTKRWAEGSVAPRALSSQFIRIYLVYQHLGLLGDNWCWPCCCTDSVIVTQLQNNLWHLCTNLLTFYAFTAETDVFLFLSSNNGPHVATLGPLPGEALNSWWLRSYWVLMSYFLKKLIETVPHAVMSHFGHTGRPPPTWKGSSRRWGWAWRQRGRCPAQWHRHWAEGDRCQTSCCSRVKNVENPNHTGILPRREYMLNKHCNCLWSRESRHGSWINLLPL